MKFQHRQSERLITPKKHDIPPRIQAQIETACAWYYQYFYPKRESASIGRPDRM
jgi:sulfotransferase